MHPERLAADHYRVHVDPAWPGFAGHFPGDPLLPAAVLVDLAIAIAEDTGHRVVGVQRARFRHPVRPDDRLEWRGQLQAGRYRLAVSSDAQTVAEIRLELASSG